MIWPTAANAPAPKSAERPSVSTTAAPTIGDSAAGIPSAKLEAAIAAFAD